MATRVISLALCLTALCIVQPSDCTLPERVHQFILSVIGKFPTEHGKFIYNTCLFNFFHYAYPTITWFSRGEEDFLQPFIILWNPNITYHEVVNDVLQRCVTCGSPYTMMYWNDGSSAGREPRVTQSMDNIVYLVSAVYVCCNNHRLLAHDPIIQKCFPIQTVIPFVLLHKTRDFAGMCVSLVRNGMNFYAIESLVIERRMETYATGISHFRLNKQFTNYQRFSDSLLSKCPSNSVIATLFVALFLDNESSHLHEIEKITVVSFDHSFKVASYIGYCRSDNVWVTACLLS